MMKGLNIINGLIQTKRQEQFLKGNTPKMTRKKSKDSINPEHYTEGQIEFIDYAKETMSKEAFEGGLEFNIKKYTHRWKEKDGVQDLKKAEWYLQRLIREKE